MHPRAPSLIALLFASACGSSTVETASGESDATPAEPAQVVEPEAEPPSEPEPAAPSEPTAPTEPTEPSEPSEPEPARPRTALRHQLSDSCAIRSDELLCWVPPNGRDAQRVALDSKPVSVSGNCALLESGSVVCFQPNARPRRIAALEGVSALASSEVMTCGVRAGEVVCLHASGKQSVVKPITDAVDLAVDDRWACAVRASGKVSCWETSGLEYEYYVGWADEVIGLTGVVEVSLRGFYRCARTEAGEVLCWEHQFPFPPKKVDGIERATGVAAARYYSCALVDGEVLCWGDNSGPFRLPDIEDAVELINGNDYFCALQADDRVKCWAPNSNPLTPHGQHNPVWRTNVAGARFAEFAKIGPIVLTEAGKLELHDPAWAQWAPELAQLSDVVDFAVEPFFARSLCVVTKAEGWRCWNRRDEEPKQLAPPDAGFHAISEVCGISANGQLFCSDNGELQEVNLGDGMGELVDADSGGGSWEPHVCAVDNEGRIRCFGDNDFGQLGQGHNDEMSTKEPVTPKGVRDVVEVDTEIAYTCARTKKGRVWCWGAWGDLEDRRKLPLPHDIGVKGAEQISVSEQLACARDQDNTVWCWVEEVGSSPAEDMFVRPYKVHALKGSTDIRVSRGRVCGVQDSEVRCWWSGMADVQENYMTLPVDIGLPDPPGNRLLDLGGLLRGR